MDNNPHYPSPKPLRVYYILLFLLLVIAKPIASQILINEVDYDNLGSDNAEFVELLNIGIESIDLGVDHYEIVFYRTDGSEYNRESTPNVWFSSTKPGPKRT